MKNKNLWLTILSVALICCLAVAVTACKATDFTIQFIVDDVDYATLSTSGQEVIRMPQNPAKDGYTFDGWYWDVGTWQRPFTANSLLNEPLTSNMSVYAKFTEIHNHILTLQPAVKADCEHVGNEAYYTCTCGKMFADAQATVELTAVPTINKTEHTPTDWIVDSKATCTADGSKHIECAVCHTTLQTQAIPSNGHTPEKEWIIDKTATCTVEGSKHLECSVCHATLQTSVIPATGHSYSTAWSKDERGHWHVATCEHTTETTAIEPHTYDSNYKCKVCGYQDVSLHGTEIATDVFTVDGETLYAKTPNSQTTFSFINAIQVADDATFVVATDLAASNVIRTKTVSLKIGDNTYYILVENGNDIKLYTVTLRRRPIYTITFVTNGGTACATQQIEEDSLATKPTTSKTGYTFANWDYDFATPVIQNTTITASWTANEYTVTYDVNGGVLADTQYTATYDSAYTLAVPTREGHTFQGWYVDDTQITYANGQSVADWAYTEDKTATAKWVINSYTLTITNPNSNAGTVAGTGTYVYDSEVTVTAQLYLGYEFLGWYNDEQVLSTSQTYTFNMLSKNITLTAKYDVAEEMSNYVFSSTTKTCQIKGVKDTTIIRAEIPNYVTGISNMAFSSCSLLSDIYINDISKWCSIDFEGHGASPFYWHANNLYLNGQLVENLEIPQGTTHINAYSFLQCNSITSVTIPDSVESVGAMAFCRCRNLAAINWNAIWVSDATRYADIFCESGRNMVVNFGNDVERIPSYLFSKGQYSNAPSIESVTIGKSVRSIGDHAFDGCNISEIKWGAISVADFTEKSNVFENASPSGLTIIFSDDVKIIPAYLFYVGKNDSGSFYYFNTSNRPIVKNVVMGKGIKSIGKAAFYGCSNMTSLIIPDSVTSIGDSAFRGCSSLTSITIGNSITSISFSAFYSCGSLKNVYYNGGEDHWKNITIDSNNSCLTRATRYYYSETEPELNVDGTVYDGNYWHYNDNHEAVVWEYKKENN